MPEINSSSPVDKADLDGEVEHLDSKLATHARDTMPDSLRDLSSEEVNKIMRKATIKMDVVVMPCLMIMYILNYLDRNNIAIAKLADITKDLQLSDTQYQTSVSILFVGYSKWRKGHLCKQYGTVRLTPEHLVLFQIPSNMIIGKTKRPGTYVALAMALWGVVSAASGAVHSFGSLVTTRFLVGIAETVFFPGALYYLSIFYNREQYAFRAALLYSGSQLGNAFGGLLGIAILKLDGVRGLQGWRWVSQSRL